jgi:hypothetical protein
MAPKASVSNNNQMPRELKLQACLRAFEGLKHLPPLKTEALCSVGNAFERNVGRVFSLLHFPIIAVTTATITQSAVAQIMKEMPQASEEEQTKAVATRTLAHYELRHEALKRGGARANELKEIEIDNAFVTLRETARMMEEGAEAWLAAQITGTWTAFEAMAEDLWETALNTKPKWLAGLSGEDRLNRRQQKETLHGANRHGDEDKKVDLEWLQRNGYDLSKCMGTVHKRRYKFDSLTGIRKAFAEAFSKDRAAIDAILADKVLDALALVRNNLVHSGGIVDEEIIRRAGDLPTELHRTITIGTPILLDGELVSQLVGPVLKCGHDLVVAVDDWLVSH